MSDKCGDCSAGRCPTQQRSQSPPMPMVWRCAGEAAAVLTISTAHVATNSSTAFQELLWNTFYIITTTRATPT